ncbi:MAG: lipoate--protein ligase [Lentisphaeria bacterium]
MSAKTGYLLTSESTDPFFNLALEEWLLRASPYQSCTLVYRNKPSIVMGRNQNPWLECNLDFVEANNLILTRRISGGGTVYHDLGNANFTFVMPRKQYAPRVHLKLVAEALTKLGVQADITDRNNLFVNRAKISGTAFMLTGKRALQHGTLLINADLQKLNQALENSLPEVDTHAVASVSDAVTNLVDIIPDISYQQFIDAIRAVLMDRTADLKVSTLSESDFSENQDFQKYYRLQHSRNWVYGKTPAFSFYTRLPNGNSESANYQISVKGGRINEICPEPVCPLGDTSIRQLMSFPKKQEDVSCDEDQRQGHLSPTATQQRAGFPENKKI